MYLGVKIICNVRCISTCCRHHGNESEMQYYRFTRLLGVHTVGPANKEVPESAIAEQPPEQNPEGVID